MNKKQLNIALLTTFAFFTTTFFRSFCQVPQKPISVPSPTVMTMQQYGSINTNHNIGAAQIEVPLHNFNYGGLDMPFVLRHNSTGVRVNQVPGWVGVNWSLSVGGSITRQIKGLPDEFQFSVYRQQLPIFSNFSGGQYNNGFLHNNEVISPSYFTSQLAKNFQPFQSRVPDCGSVESIIRVPQNPIPYCGIMHALDFPCHLTPLQQGPVSWSTNSFNETLDWQSKGRLDYEPDNFSFSAFDLNGSFQFKKPFSIEVVANREVKVEMFYGNAATLRVPFIPPLPSIEISTSGSSTNPAYAVEIARYNRWSPWYEKGEYPRVISGFKLTDDRGIEYYFGRTAEMLDEPIVDPSFEYYNGVAIEYSIGEAAQTESSSTNLSDIDFWKADAWHIVRVKFPNGKKIDFNYERGSEIVLFSKGGSNAKNFEEYNSQSAPILWHKEKRSPSYLKEIRSDLINADFFGAPNINDLIPGETKTKHFKLNSLTIKPHNAKTVKVNLLYNYDATNRWYLSEVVQLKQNNIPLTSYKFSYDNINGLPAINIFNVDHWGFFNNTNSYAVWPGTFAERESNPNFLQFGSLTKIEYPTGGFTEFEYEPNTVSKIVKPKAYLGIDGVPKYTVGGLRIKQIFNSDGLTGRKLYKKYYYTNEFNSSLTEAQLAALPSSGILNYKPVYFLAATIGNASSISHSNGGIGAFQFSRSNASNVPVNIFSSQPINALIDDFHVGYSTVTEQNADGSYTIYKFTDFETNLDDPPLLEFNNFVNSPYSKSSSKTMERGKLKDKQHFKSDGSLVSKELYEYTADFKNPDGSLPSSNIFQIQSFETVPSQNWNSNIYQFSIANQYKRYLHKYVENFKNTIVYDDNGVPSNRTEHKYYDNPLHKQVTKTVSTNSKGDVLTTYLRYAQDFGNSNFLVSRMVENGHGTTPVEVITTVKKAGTTQELITSAKLNQYNLLQQASNNVYVSAIYELSLEGNLLLTAMSPTTIDNFSYGGSWTKDSRYKLKFKANRLDNTNYNLLDYTLADGVRRGVVYDRKNLKPQATFNPIPDEAIDPGYELSGRRYCFANFETADRMNDQNIDYDQWFFDNNIAHTGKYSYKGVLYIRHNGTNYSNNLGFAFCNIDLWIKDGMSMPIVQAAGIVNATVYNTLPSPTLVRSKNGWSLYRYKVTNVTPCREIKIEALNCNIDDLKLYPTNNPLIANGKTYDEEYFQFVTYGYNLDGELIFKQDYNDRIEYYEYDDFNRLILVRDESKNILKRYCYNFKGQQEDCPQGINTAPQWRPTGQTRCVPCAANPSQNSGVQEIEEIDVNPNSATHSSPPRWVVNPNGSCPRPPADYQPRMDLGTCELVNGAQTGNFIVPTQDVNSCSATYNQWGSPQVIPNYGPCVPCPTTCTGPQSICINGVCYQGVLKVIRVQKISKTLWECTRAYCFDFNSTIGQITYTMPANTTYFETFTSSTACPIECFY
jgi:hypothetical protein